MSSRNGLSFSKDRRLSTAQMRAKRRRLLNVENLECRYLMATYVVNSPLDALSTDPEVVTLRSAIAQANENFGQDTIQFALGSEPVTITLESTLEVLGSLDIIGPGSTQLIIDGGSTSPSTGVRIFDLFKDSEEFNTVVNISGVTLQNGNAGNFEGDGGAIYNHGTELSVIDSVLDSNSGGRGGAIYNENLNFFFDANEQIRYVRLSTYIINTRVTNNTANVGGAIFNDHGHIEVSEGSFISNNLAFQDAGAIYTIGQPQPIANTTLLVFDSTFSNNIAQDGSGGAVFAENDHVEFQRSAVSNNFAGADGGAIFTVNTTTQIIGTVELNNSVASGNSAAGRGGAIFAIGDTIFLRNSQISNNSAVEGGAVYTRPNDFSFSFFEARNTQFEGNQANGKAGEDARGGAVFAASGTSAAFYSTHFKNNSARGGDSSTSSEGVAGGAYGGAVYANEFLNFQTSTFTGNIARGGDGEVAGSAAGGAFWSNDQSGSFVDRSTFSNNQAIGGNGLSVGGSAFGGGMFAQLAGVDAPFQHHRIEASTFNGNVAKKGAGAEAFADGGGLWGSDGIFLYNSTVSGNRADDDGGGIYIGPSTITDGISKIESSTIVLNVADADGDENGTGAGLRINSDFLPTLISSIVSLNTVGGVADNVTGSIAPTVSVANLINDDPLIGPLADNGGSTKTHELLPGSPALGNGLVVERALDQRGLERLGSNDIGSYEVSFDYGDAFVSGEVNEVNYPTLHANDGARHKIGALYFGSISNLAFVPVDSDLDGGTATGAAGDDNFNDDEDGIRFATAAAGFLARVDVNSSGTGFLNAWIDFNGDRDWDDAGEQIFSGTPVVAGINQLTFSVPALAGDVPQTFARFRLSSQAQLGPAGEAPDGEVEDYRLSIQTVVLPGGGGEGGSFTFTDTVERRVRRTYDPFVATGYDYEVTSGPSFAEVEVFAGFGDSVYTLSVDDPANPGTFLEVATLHGGQTYDFEGMPTSLQVAGGGVRKFRLSGIETSAALDPNSSTAFPTAISFVASGDVSFTQTPLTVFVNAPAEIVGTKTGEVTEDGTSTVSGDLDVNDIDAGQNVFQTPASLSGTYGAFTFNTTTGVWEYLLDNSDADTNALAAGQIVYDSLVVKSFDDTASATISVKVIGANDAATITGSSTAALTEDSSSNAASGDLDVDDVDSVKEFRTPVSLAAIYGFFNFNAASGTWTYTLDNLDPDTNALRGGQIVEDRITVESSDGSASRDLVITITGNNDAATITGSRTGAVNEDDATTLVSGDLDINDPDSPTSFQVPAVGSLQGTYGAFTFNATSGAWSYTINNADADTNALTAGQIVTDSLTVLSDDGTSQAKIEVTITGSNDAATISGTATGALVEDAATTTVGGDLDIVDPDSPTTFQTPASLAGVYGNFTFNPASGVWTYLINNADPDTNALSTGQVVHDTLSVKSQDGTATKVIDVTITGVTDSAVNNPPVASLTAPARGVRGQELTFTVAATDSAADQAAGFTYKIVWGDGTPDTVVPRTAGNGAGVTVTHTFVRSATFTVSLVATDQGGKTSSSVTKAVVVNSAAIQTTGAGSVLVVGGTTSSDIIGVGRYVGGIEVCINGVKTRFSQAVTRILVYAQAGNDFVTISSQLSTPSFIDGGDGNDYLYAGGGRTILQGGAGDDWLVGGMSRDLLIGGLGKDKLFGTAGGDILIGARSTHESTVDTLFSILAQWNSSSSYTTRVTALSTVLNTSTVINDSAEDLLSGSTGTDWFFARRTGTARDTVFAAIGEKITDI